MLSWLDRVVVRLQSCFTKDEARRIPANIAKLQAGLKRDLPTLLRSLDWMQTQIDQVSMIECPCSIMPQLRLDSNPVLIIRFARLQSALKNLRPFLKTSVLCSSRQNMSEQNAPQIRCDDRE